MSSCRHAQHGQALASTVNVGAGQTCCKWKMVASEGSLERIDWQIKKKTEIGLTHVQPELI